MFPRKNLTIGERPAPCVAPPLGPYTVRSSDGAGDARTEHVFTARDSMLVMWIYTASNDPACTFTGYIDGRAIPPLPLHRGADDLVTSVPPEMMRDAEFAERMAELRHPFELKKGQRLVLTSSAPVRVAIAGYLDERRGP